MFDSGASRSFVSPLFASKFGISTSRLSRSIKVEIADGRLSEVHDIYRDCSIEIEGMAFPIQLLPITLAGLMLLLIWIGWEV